MTFLVEWGLNSDTDDVHERSITTEAELRNLLDEIERNATPTVVTIYPENEEHDGLQIGVGHPDRAFVFRVTAHGGYDTQPNLGEWPARITFDYNGEPTDYAPADTRMTPDAARRAAYDYVRTAQLQHA